MPSAYSRANYPLLTSSDFALIENCGAGGCPRDDLIAAARGYRMQLSPRGLQFYAAAISYYGLSQVIEDIETYPALIRLCQALAQAWVAQHRHALALRLAAGRIPVQDRAWVEAMLHSADELEQMTRARQRERCAAAGANVVPLPRRRP